MTSFDLNATMQQCQLEVDEALSCYLPPKSLFPVRLHESMHYSLFAGGKRIRPILCMAAFEALGGRRQDVLQVACALEMIHTFSLIHDDLPCMDDDDFRRGVPTNHRVFGEAMAVLAGDAMVSQAFLILSQIKNERFDPLRIMEIIRDIALSTGSQGMVGGQVVDLESEGKSLDLEELKRLHRLKTGRLIAVSVTSGAKLGTHDPALIRIFEGYGEKIGLAFQIADDVLDIEGTREELGKDIGSDIANHKATYPELMGLTAAKGEAHLLCQEAIETLSPLGDKACFLKHLAQYIVLRKK